MVLSTRQMIILLSCQITGSHPADIEIQAALPAMAVSLGSIGLFTTRLRQKKYHFYRIWPRGKSTQIFVYESNNYFKSGQDTCIKI